jgi:hypothetical protein
LRVVEVGLRLIVGSLQATKINEALQGSRLAGKRMLRHCWYSGNGKNGDRDPYSPRLVRTIG